ncbi:MAG: RluA family pseudouridine synthase [Gammaproteobacteria bacterium]|nr:RluA family pseudouridine synthase [Gammaproteobacteria bacterium]
MTSPQTHFEHHILIIEDEPKAVEPLVRETGLSKQHLKQVMQKGAVWLSREGYTQRIRRASKPLKAGDQLHLYYDARILGSEPSIPQLIADETAYSIWYKPYGMLCQGSKWGDHCTIQRWVEGNLQPQRLAFIVHRLDRAATGLIILAHEKKTAARFSQMFSRRLLDKRYQIIVHGNFPTGPDPVTVNEPVDGKSACSHFNRIDYDSAGNRSLLEVTIESGRKHQIRRHSASLGFPVVGDRLYGQPGGDEDLQLTAWQLAFDCPLTGEHRRYQLDEARLPHL